MQRVAFPEGGQVQFLSLVFSVTNLSVEEVASICGVHPRTIRDWRRGKYRISPSAAKKLTELSGVTLPDGVQVVNRYEHLKRFSSLGGKRNQNIELSFSNRSLPLLDFIEQTLAHLDFTPRRYGAKCVNLRKQIEVERYFEEVGTNNPKHQLRFDQFLKNKFNLIKYLRRGA